jgi:hypothetical protein
VVEEGLDSSVGIAACYGLDGPGIEFRSGRDITYPFRPALGPIWPLVLVQWIPGLSQGSGGRGVALTTPPSSVEVKERVELYLYFSLGLLCMF